MFFQLSSKRAQLPLCSRPWWPRNVLCSRRASPSRPPGQAGLKAVLRRWVRPVTCFSVWALQPGRPSGGGSDLAELPIETPGQTGTAAGWGLHPGATPRGTRPAGIRALTVTSPLPLPCSCLLRQHPRGPPGNCPQTPGKRRVLCTWGRPSAALRGPDRVTRPQGKRPLAPRTRRPCCPLAGGRGLWRSLPARGLPPAASRSTGATAGSHTLSHLALLMRSHLLFLSPRSPVCDGSFFYCIFTDFFIVLGS